MCYTKLTALGFDLVSRTTLYGASKDDSDHHHVVFWLDGTKEYVAPAYLYYIVIGIICLCIVGLSPCFMCCYPWLKHRRFCDYFNRDNQLLQYYDAFQECLKDTPVVCRFSAAYFWYRFFVVLLCAITQLIVDQFFGLSCLYLLMLAIHCWLQPYKNNFYNIIDASMFINLTLISIISFYRLYAVALDLSETVNSFVFQTILIYLPFVYIILLVLWRRYLRYHKIKNSDDLPCEPLKELYLFTQDNEENDEDDDNNRDSDIEDSMGNQSARLINSAAYDVVL